MGRCLMSLWRGYVLRTAGRWEGELKTHAKSARASQRRILNAYGLSFYHRFVRSDPSVANMNDAMGMLRDVVLVSHENNGIALGVQVPKQGHNFVAGFGVEVSGGLVGQHD